MNQRTQIEPTNMIFSRNKDTAGFTLIEIVVVVFIFGVIISIVAPAMSQFFDARERIIAKQAQMESIQKTILFLSRDLRYAVNRLSKDEFGQLENTTLILDDGSLVELIASYPDLNLDGLNVPRRVEWLIEEGNLVRLQSPVMDPDGDTRQLKQVVLEGVRDVDMEVGVVEDGRDRDTKRWNEQSRLPDLMRVTIKMENRLEYQRNIEMLSGDNNDAQAISANQQSSTQQQNNEQQENQPSGPSDIPDDLIDDDS